MVASLGLGVILLIVGLAFFFVPGIGVFGVVLLLLGVLLIAGSFVSSRRRTTPPPG